MSRRRLLLALALGSLTSGHPAFGGLAGDCRVADRPAATLLFPYFEVDLNDASGATTLVSVNNASSKPALTRVVLWTDWGVPTLAFDVYLTGYDVQTLNLRDLFRGELPVTGAGISNVGSTSRPGEPFAGCAGGASAALKTAERDQLRAAHTGRPVSGTKRCAGSGRAGAGIAAGYVTVDAVNRCTPVSVLAIENTPAHAGYFGDGGTGLASNANVLWGDVVSLNSRLGTAESEAAVPVVADADFFSPGDYTFYGRFVDFDSRDNRAPLSSLYYGRYANGGGALGATDLIVWRDPRTPQPQMAECGKGPWPPLGEMQLVAFDEEENPIQIPRSNAFPLATQKVRVGGPALPVPERSGWLMLDLWHADGTHAQAWVTVVLGAGGRLSAGHEAVRADDLCNFGL